VSPEEEAARIKLEQLVIECHATILEILDKIVEARILLRGLAREGKK